MKGLRNLISVVTVIILTIMGIYAVCIFNASHFLTEKNLTKTAKKMNLMEILSDDGKVTAGGVNTSPMEQIYGMADTAHISREHVDAMMKSDVVKEFAGDYLSNVATYITTGEEKNITGSQLVELVRNNIDTIATESNLNLDATAKQNIVRGVEQYANQIVTLVPSPKQVTESIDEDQLKGIQSLLSKDSKQKLVFGIIGLTALLILLQFSWWKWLSWSSISVVITGAVSCILGLITTPMIEGLLVDHNEVILLSLLNRFTEALAKNFYLIGGVLLLVAFIEISIYVNIRHHMKQKEANKARESLQEQSSLQ